MTQNFVIIDKPFMLLSGLKIPLQWLSRTILQEKISSMICLIGKNKKDTIIATLARKAKK